MDKWDRKTNFNCNSCMFFVPKHEHSSNPHNFEGRCRRQAPKMKGYPVVYGNKDWCGEHKIGSNPVRDGKEASITLYLHRNEVKEKIKAEIGTLLDIITQTARAYVEFDREVIPEMAKMVKELLEKL